MTEDAPKDYTEISFVCLREDGCPELPATVETACRTAAGKKLELEGFHFHILRHSHASLLISKLKAQPNLVADRLGHEKIQTTLSAYSHLYPNESGNLAEQLNGFMEESDDEEGENDNAGKA